MCPELCLKLVPASSLKGSQVEETLRHQLRDYPLEEASAIIKDEDKCIRCGLCVERCPTGAIAMERFSFEEVWRAESV